MAERIGVFISSTSLDLKQHREAVAKTILRLGMHPIDMTDFNASDRNALQLCYDKVREADVFIGIYAQRYGYAPDASVTYRDADGKIRHGDGETSITQHEYLWAKARGIPLLLFVVDESVPWPPKDIDDEPGKSRLKTFKARIGKEHVWQTFSTPDSLASAAATSLAELLTTLHKPIRPAPTTPPRQTSVTPDARRILLSKVREFWIDGYLKKTKLNDVWLDLPAAERPDAVEPLVARALAAGDAAPFVLTAQTQIGPLFRATERALLILGAHGAGKTITLLELAEDLLDEADADPTRPIPLVLNLASWAENAPERLEDWLAERLTRDYGVSSKAAKRWIDDGALLFLLDGLDEVAQDKRDACVTSINAYWQGAQRWGDNGLAVCSRIEEYASLSARLNVQKAIQIEPLALGQAQEYAAKLGAAWEGLRAALATDTTLQSLAQSPLDLNIMAVAYRGKAAGELSGFADAETQERHLYDNYVTQRLREEGAHPRYSHTQTRHYLAWLAKAMVTHDRIVFHIEDLRGTWLDEGQHKQARRATLVVGMGHGLFFGLGGRNLISTAFDSPYFAERLSFRQKGLRIRRVSRQNFVLFFGLVVEAIDLKTRPNQSVWRSLRSGLFFGLVSGLFFGLVSGLFFGLVSGLVVGLIGGLGSGLVVGLIGALVGGLFFGLVVGLLGGLRYGLAAVIAHVILRRVLWRSGDAPWNYADFLTYTSARHLTRQVGGGFLFRHRKLMEHFARSGW